VNELSARKADAVEYVPADLSGKLQWLCKFGRPSTSMMDSGWHARIIMNTNTTGTSFDVKSEYDLTSPDRAVEQLIERMLCALAKLGERA
jgi:hypothetical protein